MKVKLIAKTNHKEIECRLDVQVTTGLEYYRWKN